MGTCILCADRLTSWACVVKIICVVVRRRDREHRITVSDLYMKHNKSFLTGRLISSTALIYWQPSCFTHRLQEGLLLVDFNYYHSSKFGSESGQKVMHHWLGEVCLCIEHSTIGKSNCHSFFSALSYFQQLHNVNSSPGGRPNMQSFTKPATMSSCRAQLLIVYHNDNDPTRSFLPIKVF